MSESPRDAWSALYEQRQVKPVASRKVNLLGKDTGPLPSLRGPRSPKGKAGGMTAEQDKARRLERQRVARAVRSKRFVSERMVLRACMDVLEAHPFVALWWRQNTGAGQLANGQYVKFSFSGCSDLLGMATDGRLIAVECKATGKAASPDQAAFLSNVAAHNGYSICVDDAGKLAGWLYGLQMAQNGLTEQISGK